MELRDYIYQYNNPPVQKKKRIRQPVFGTALDLCDVISENKKQLIRDAFYEIGKRHFQDAVERWNQERPEPGYNSAFYQTVAEDGRRGVSQIKICNLVGTYDFPERIPAEEFYEDYN